MPLDDDAVRSLGDSPTVVRGAETVLPARSATWRCIGYTDVSRGETHVALTMGDVGAAEPALVRIHSECLTGDAFGSLRCDCRAQLDLAMSRIVSLDRGVIVYLRQEGRGIGLADKLRAYALQDQGVDTVDANRRLGHEADPRDYAAAAAILRDLGLRRIRLLTNNPRKREGLVRHGIEVTQMVELATPPTRHNAEYLRTKRDRLGHILGNLLPEPPPPTG